MSHPYHEPPRAPAPQPIQHVQVVVPHVRQSQALPALVSFFLPGVGQLIQGRVMAWLAFSLAWGIGLVLCFFCVGFFVVPLVALIATVEAALYDPAQPPSAVPMLAMFGALGVSAAAVVLLLLGIIGLGATAASLPPVEPSTTNPAASSPADATAPIEPAPIEPAPIVIDDSPPAIVSPAVTPAQTPSEPTPEATAAKTPAAASDESSDASSDTDPIPPVERPMRVEREFRTWTSGMYKTEAQFFSMTAGKVKLKKRDGTIVEVPLEKFSEDDQEYIRSGAYKQGE